ncbi:MAG: hypothetical protein ABIR80_01045, partial [Opitutaceae bacterium]
MSLQDFIAFWQARPFRAFRMHTARGVFVVDYPLRVALSPELRVAVVGDDDRVEILARDEVERCEAYGKSRAPEEAIAAVAPETLARHAKILSDALLASSPPPAAGKSDRAFDPGTVSFLPTHNPEGVFTVHVSVRTRNGPAVFDTFGTRWNLHGVEQFENGTSLYLHHLDHPTLEQRVILWPPDFGTFESFAERKKVAALGAELRKRDTRLAAKPAKTVEPPAAYFKKCVPEYRVFDPDAYRKAFGEDPEEPDFDRYEIHLVPREIAGEGVVKNPCLFDVLAEEILFNLTDTDWDATFERGERSIQLALRFPRRGKNILNLSLDPYRLTARVEQDEVDLPLGFVERHLRNYALYEPWDLMLDALRAGPVKPRQPDLVLPLAHGFRTELWAGENRFPLPFLQPRLLDPAGRTLLDLRATTWAAIVSADPAQPRVALRLVSHEEKERDA